MRQWARQGQLSTPLSRRARGRQRRQPGCYQYCADAPYGASATYWDGAPVLVRSGDDVARQRGLRPRSLDRRVTGDDEAGADVVVVVVVVVVVGSSFAFSPQEASRPIASPAVTAIPATIFLRVELRTVVIPVLLLSIPFAPTALATKKRASRS